MGSFALRNPLVFAYEWASLDVLSNGRTRLVACAGGGAGPLWEAESAAMNFAPGERRKRMIENIHVLRHLWTKDNAPFVGQFTNFSNVTLEPKPVQSPCPIWLATNAERLSKGQADSGGSEVALTRVGTIADGWMTHSVSPQGFPALVGFHSAGRPRPWPRHVRLRQCSLPPHQRERRQGRRAGGFEDVSRSLLFRRLQQGAPGILADLRFATRLHRAAQAIQGVRLPAHHLRISTMGDPMEQFRRVAEEVLPFVN
jgi:alkanesulfonate monooxygenase SsuD/methylene tetrahydromethanopterin reductase-like flavin-dependent oxidoreductase (luciferase family)